MNKPVLTSKMSRLYKVYLDESMKVDPLRNDIFCDTDLSRAYLRAYDYYRICINMPEDHTLYSLFYQMCDSAIHECLMKM